MPAARVARSPTGAPQSPALSRAQGGHKLRVSLTKVPSLPTADEIMAEKYAELSVVVPSGMAEGDHASAPSGSK